MKIEGFNFEFFAKRLCCPKCESGRGFFMKSLNSSQSPDRMEPDEWLQVRCGCGYCWNELTADSKETVEQFAQRVNPGAVRA